MAILFHQINRYRVICIFICFWLITFGFNFELNLTGNA